MKAEIVQFFVMWINKAAVVSINVKFKITWSLKDRLFGDEVVRTVTESFTLEEIEAGDPLNYLNSINDMEMDTFGTITARRQYIGVNDVNNVEIYEGDSIGVKLVEKLKPIDCTVKWGIAGWLAAANGYQTWRFTRDERGIDDRIEVVKG